MEIGNVHKAGGSTGSNVLERGKGEDDPSKFACLPLSGFLEIIYKWVIDEYSQRYHKGAQGIPYRVWQDGVTRFPPAWPDDTKDVPALLGLVYERYVRNKGVELEGLFYNSPELNRLLRSFSKWNNGMHQKFTVKVDPLDIEYVYVYDHITSNRWIKVSAVNPQYAKGKSMLEHKITRRQRKAEFGTEDTIDLAISNSEILQMQEKWGERVHGQKRSKGKKTKQTSATPDKPTFDIKLLESGSATGLSDVGATPVISMTSEPPTVVELNQAKSRQKRSNGGGHSKKRPDARAASPTNSLPPGEVIDMSAFGVSFADDSDLR